MIQGKNVLAWSRRALGAVARDLPHYVPSFFSAGGWLLARNRNDRLKRIPGGWTVACGDIYSSDLHACHIFPRLGRHLMRCALRQWPIVAATPTRRRPVKPDISFVIPHRGRQRAPLLRATIASVLAQKDVNIECIVIEQSDVREVFDLPASVQHIHLRHASDPAPWRKCWAFNEGVRSAQADIVVCHDSDILVPQCYGREILRWMSADFEVMHSHRFLFCLTRDDTEALLREMTVRPHWIPERVRQNWKGGTLAIRRSSYWRIGGFDERFVDWTGEDLEFYDRCLTLPGLRNGYLPFVHLWHPPQLAKVSSARHDNIDFTHLVLAVPREERIRELTQRMGAA